MRVRAAAVSDEVRRGGRGVVLVGSRVVRLSETGMALRTLAQGWVSLVELTRGLVAEFGQPDGQDAEVAVAAMVDDLVRSGLLEVDPGG